MAIKSIRSFFGITSEQKRVEPEDYKRVADELTKKVQEDEVRGELTAQKLKEIDALLAAVIANYQHALHHGIGLNSPYSTDKDNAYRQTAEDLAELTKNDDKILGPLSYNAIHHVYTEFLAKYVAAGDGSRRSDALQSAKVASDLVVNMMGSPNCPLSVKMGLLQANERNMDSRMRFQNQFDTKGYVDDFSNINIVATTDKSHVSNLCLRIRMLDALCKTESMEPSFVQEQMEKLDHSIKDAVSNGIMPLEKVTSMPEFSSLKKYGLDCGETQRIIDEKYLDSSETTAVAKMPTAKQHKKENIQVDFENHGINREMLTQLGE